MKRSYSTEEENIFSIIPLEITNGIQFHLLTVSLINFGRTCKYLYRIQKPFMLLKEKQIYDIYMRRIKKDLKKKGLFDFLKHFLRQFESAIRGNYLDYYLTHDTGHSDSCILVEMPTSICFLEVMDYIEKRNDPERYHMEQEHAESEDSENSNQDPNFDMITLYARGDFGGAELRFIFTDSENVRDASLHWSDLKKIYCRNLWQLLASKGK